MWIIYRGIGPHTPSLWALPWPIRKDNKVNDTLITVLVVLAIVAVLLYILRGRR